MVHVICIKLCSGISNQKLNRHTFNTTEINCEYLGDLHTQAKYSLSWSVLYTEAPKDHDDEGKDFAPTDLLASALGACLITILASEAKRRGWELGKINIDVYKEMTLQGPGKIKNTCTRNLYASWNRFS